MAAASLDYHEDEGAACLAGEVGAVARLAGDWTLVGIASLGSSSFDSLPALEARLADVVRCGAVRWDLRAIDRLDSVGALLLWRAWGRRLPDDLLLSDSQRRVFARVAAIPPRVTGASERRRLLPLLLIGRGALKAQHLLLGRSR